MIRENRLAKLERLAGPEREALLYNRRIMLSAIPELMAKLDIDEAEARRLFALCNPPEIAALIADDWERNPCALDLLKTLREPNGSRKLLEAGLGCGANAFG